ncbi:trichohyalin-like isoform X2 [Lineus longissimus]|uniref:trichohyalin-like isoform X2 n=1 Tax=Lineus longissimus TaxID=88925 RepID=UPI00315CC160
MIFPSLFELIGMMEQYHPRINLRWQLVRILVLYLMNLYTLVFALYVKIINTTEQIETETALYEEKLNAYWGNMTLNCTNEYLYQDDNVTDTGVSLSTISPPNCTNISSAERPLELTAGLCWETMVGQEMYKLTAMDLVMTGAGILVIDFFRGLFVRYANICWCWDLELKFPEYGEFKIAENILHLIYNQGMIWMGFFFAPALPTINIFKLLAMLYLRAWAVMMCNIPHERIFKASRSNNFYFALLLMMLFLCALPAGYCMVQIPPSPNCGAFAGQQYMYHVLMQFIEAELPAVVGKALNIIASPTIIIPVFILLVMGLYYLSAMVQSLKESNTELKDQLEYERTEEKKKIYAMADARAKGEDDTGTGTGTKTKEDKTKTSNNVSKNVGNATVTVSKYGDKEIADVPTIRGRDGENNMVKIVSGNKEKLVSIDHLQQLVQHQNNMSPKNTPVAVVTGKPNVKQSVPPTRSKNKKSKRKNEGDQEAPSRDRSKPRDHVINICLNEDQHLGEGVSDQCQGQMDNKKTQKQQKKEEKKKEKEMRKALEQRLAQEQRAAKGNKSKEVVDKWRKVIVKAKSKKSENDVSEEDITRDKGKGKKSKSQDVSKKWKKAMKNVVKNEEGKGGKGKTGKKIDKKDQDLGSSEDLVESDDQVLEERVTRKKMRIAGKKGNHSTDNLGSSDDQLSDEGAKKRRATSGKDEGHGSNDHLGDNENQIVDKRTEPGRGGEVKNSREVVERGTAKRSFGAAPNSHENVKNKERVKLVKKSDVAHDREGGNAKKGEHRKIKHERSDIEIESEDEHSNRETASEGESDTEMNRNPCELPSAPKTYPMPKNLHQAVLTKGKRQQEPPEIIITRGTSEASSEAEERANVVETLRSKGAKGHWNDMSEAVQKLAVVAGGAVAGTSESDIKHSRSRNNVSKNWRDTDKPQGQRDWQRNPVVREQNNGTPGLIAVNSDEEEIQNNPQGQWSTDHKTGGRNNRVKDELPIQYTQNVYRQQHQQFSPRDQRTQRPPPNPAQTAAEKKSKGHERSQTDSQQRGSGAQKQNRESVEIHRPRQDRQAVHRPQDTQDQRHRHDFQNIQRPGAQYAPSRPWRATRGIESSSEDEEEIPSQDHLDILRSTRPPERDDHRPREAHQDVRRYRTTAYEGQAPREVKKANQKLWAAERDVLRPSDDHLGNPRERTTNQGVPRSKISHQDIQRPGMRTTDPDKHRHGEDYQDLPASRNVQTRKEDYQGIEPRTAAPNIQTPRKDRKDFQRPTTAAQDEQQPRDIYKYIAEPKTSRNEQRIREGTKDIHRPRIVAQDARRPREENNPRPSTTAQDEQWARDEDIPRSRTAARNVERPTENQGDVPRHKIPRQDRLRNRQDSPDLHRTKGNLKPITISQQHDTDYPEHETEIETMEDQPESSDFDFITRGIGGTKNSFSDMMKSRPRRQQSHRSLTRPDVIHRALLMESGTLSVGADYNDKRRDRGDSSQSEDGFDEDDLRFHRQPDLEEGPYHLVAGARNDEPHDHYALPSSRSYTNQDMYDQNDDSNIDVRQEGEFQDDEPYSDEEDDANNQDEGRNSQSFSHFADVVQEAVRQKRRLQGMDDRGSTSSIPPRERSFDFGESLTDDYVEDGNEEQSLNQSYPHMVDVVDEVVRRSDFEKRHKHDDGGEGHNGTGQFCRKGRHVHYPSEGEDDNSDDENPSGPNGKGGRKQHSSPDKLRNNRGHSQNPRPHHSSSDGVRQKQGKVHHSSSDELDQYSRRQDYTTDKTETEGRSKRKLKRYLSVEDAYYPEQIQMDLYETPSAKHKDKRHESSSGKKRGKSKQKRGRSVDSDSHSDVNRSSREQTMDEDSDDAFMQVINEQRRRRKNSKKRRK